MKKLKKAQLKTINGGSAPAGCNNWNPAARCCRAWAADYCGNDTCPDSPPPFC